MPDRASSPSGKAFAFRHCWHLSWVMVATRDFGAIFWHMPTLGALTLAHVERGGIVAMMILVVTGFWFRDLKVARLRWVDCSLTSTELVMLGMTWFAILGPTGLCIER